MRNQKRFLSLNGRWLPIVSIMLIVVQGFEFYKHALTHFWEQHNIQALCIELAISSLIYSKSNPK